MKRTNIRRLVLLHTSPVCLLREHRCRRNLIDAVRLGSPVIGRSPASARCSSACPARSEAPAAGSSLPRDLLWLCDRPSPDDRHTWLMTYSLNLLHNGRFFLLRSSLFHALVFRHSPRQSPWFHSATPVFPASRGPSRSACRSAGSRWRGKPSSRQRSQRDNTERHTVGGCCCFSDCDIVSMFRHENWQTLPEDHLCLHVLVVN